MSSPKKSTTTPTPTSTLTPTLTPKPSHLPFSRRKSSDLSTINASLALQNQTMQSQLEAKTQQVEHANAEADRLKELAYRFWRDEWSGMKDYMMAFSDEVHVREIEERILGEYGELFGGGREKGPRGRKGGMD